MFNFVEQLVETARRDAEINWSNCCKYTQDNNAQRDTYGYINAFKIDLLMSVCKYSDVHIGQIN